MVDLEDGLTTLGALVAGVGTKRMLSRWWEKATGVPPPDDPSDPSTPWREALLWGISLGAAAGVARVIARRLVGKAVGDDA